MNVDKSIRKLEYFCTDEFKSKTESEKEKLIKEFYTILDGEKPTSFRKKTLEEIRIFINSLNLNLKETLSKKFVIKIKTILPCSDNNKEESDVYFQTDKGERHLIELKFGEETARNLGNSSLSNIFKIENIKLKKDEEKFFENLNKNIMSIQREEFYKLINHSKEEVENILIKNLKTYLTTYVSNFKIKSIDNDVLNKILNSTGSSSGEITTDTTKCRIDYSNDINNSIKIVSANKIGGNWKIDCFGLSPNSSRIEIKLTNKVSMVKFLMNSKNNWKEPKTKIKYAAKTGLKGIAWNVWICPI